jgi:hypothetical protein
VKSAASFEHTMHRFVKYWMPTILWMALIFLGSTDLLSAEHTSRFLVPLLRWLDPQISWAALNAVQTAIRKLGHVTDFGGAAVARASRRSRLANEDVDLGWGCFDRLRGFRCQRRVSSIVHSIADFIVSRCDDRYLRCADWPCDVYCGYRPEDC